MPARDLEAILGVTSALAAPFDLMTMLAEVVRAAKQVLHADRGSVWLHDPKTTSSCSRSRPASSRCACRSARASSARARARARSSTCRTAMRTRASTPAVDRASGYRTRCMLTLPLVDHHDVLVGVMQLLNKAGGVFDEDDEALATALAAQCAVALQRVRMTEALIEGERMRQALEMAREVQMSTLPRAMPVVEGYEVCGTFRPGRAHRRRHVRRVRERRTPRHRARRRDRPRHRARALGDADARDAPHGVPSLGADLDTAFTAGQQPARRDAAGRPLHHGVHRHARSGARTSSASRAAGRARFCKFDAATGAAIATSRRASRSARCRCQRRRPPSRCRCSPATSCVLLSDGIFEYRNPAGESFGEERVERIVRRAPSRTGRRC